MRKFLNLTPALAVAALAFPALSQGGVVISPSAGFNIDFDGNDGDFFNPGPAAPAPDNAALASNGGVAFANGESFAPTHSIAWLNNGFYGNTNNSWIGGPAAPSHAGILLPGSLNITSVAFGRDNGNGDFDNDPAGTDACGGQCNDRWGADGGAGLGAAAGTYTLQFTVDAGANWIDIGTLTYDGVGGDIAPGGAFTPWLRHEYDVSTVGGGPIVGNGIRIITPSTATAIDEIEIYGTPIPEPSGAALLALGVAGVLLRRRRG